MGSRLLLLLCGLMLLAVPASAPAAGTGTGTGGTSAPSTGGGVSAGQPIPQERPAAPRPAPAPPRPAPRVRLRVRPVASSFSVAPSTLSVGTPATFTFRVDGRMPHVRVRITLTRLGSPAPAKRLRLGYQTTGVAHTHAWIPAPGELPAGDYAVRLQAFDDAGRSLRRTARASGREELTVAVAPATPPPAPVVAGRFPVQGSYTFGSESSRFGAGRDGHVHQGQDISAVEGTPVVAPMAGVVTWVAFQAKGAGYYVVLRGEDGRDYVFMHLKAESVTAVKGLPLAAGQPFAQVGSTGGSSGPHLHFEIWPNGWYASKTSAPIDPLPQLMQWAAR